MRNLFLHINMSLDGFIEDHARDIDWHFVDDEFEEYINQILRSIDGMIFGRSAHEKLAQYWPTAATQPEASGRHLEAARMMNELPKYVVTNGRYQSEWQNTIVLSGDVATEVRRIKGEPGMDLALFAGARVVQSFIDLGLLDEYRLVVNPILLGDGTSLFSRRHKRLSLELMDATTFTSGAVVLRYRPTD